MELNLKYIIVGFDKHVGDNYDRIVSRSIEIFVTLEF